MPQIDLPRIISATRDFLHSVRDHNVFNGKLGYDVVRGMAHLAGKGVRVSEALGDRDDHDPESKLSCDMLRANVPRLSSEPGNPYLLEIVERAAAALERIQARRESGVHSGKPGVDAMLIPDDPAQLPSLLAWLNTQIHRSTTIETDPRLKLELAEGPIGTRVYEPDALLRAKNEVLARMAATKARQSSEAPVEPAAPQTEATTHLDASEIDRRVTTTDQSTDPSRQSPGVAKALRAAKGALGTPKRRRGRKRKKLTADEGRFLKAWKTGQHGTYRDCIEATGLLGVVSVKRAGQIVDADQQRMRRRSD